MSNALDDLIAKVEADSGETYNAFEAVFDNMGDAAHRAYSGSLDAALALHNAVLPGHGATVRMDGTAQLFRDSDGERFTAVCDDPARAWLIAILKAMKEGKDA